MPTEAQIQANRLNAQKSTGPRTAEGKEKVSQNAVKHGLLAREGVIRGEDGEEFERHREMLLEQLNPVGALEEILAARIVDLTWRLHRATQDQAEAFGALYDRHTGGTPEPDEPAQRGATLGRMILEDFSQDAVLERLLRYERRLESSLYRTLNELRRVHDQVQKAALEGANTLERWREEDWRARKARAFAFCPPPDVSPWPDGGTTNMPRSDVPHDADIPSFPYSHRVPGVPTADETRETNPISPGPVETQNPAAADDARANVPPVADPSCETNPISSDPKEGQALCGKEVMNGRREHGLGKTKPISDLRAERRDLESAAVCRPDLIGAGRGLLPPAEVLQSSRGPSRARSTGQRG